MKTYEWEVRQSTTGIVVYKCGEFSLTFNPATGLWIGGYGITDTTRGYKTKDEAKKALVEQLQKRARLADHAINMINLTPEIPE